MKKHVQGRRICDSWYHQKWFRILLIIVGVDMILLGAVLILGLDVSAMIEAMHMSLRIVGGLVYILVAVFIIHQALSYEKQHANIHYLCKHCAHVKKED